MNGERLAQAGEHLRLHFGNDQGRIALQQMTSDGMKQRMVNLASVSDELTKQDETGAFFSLNSFARWNRQAKSLWYTHALFVDLDCEKIGLDPDETLATLERTVFAVTLPLPTYILMSGRGIWCVWTILPRRNDRRGVNVQRWRETQAHLIDVLRPYGADPTSCDVTRTCRLAGSINTKNSADVRLTVFQGEGRYSLADLHDFASERAYDEPPPKAPRPVVDLRTLYITEESERRAGDVGNDDDLPP